MNIILQKKIILRTAFLAMALMFCYEPIQAQVDSQSGIVSSDDYDNKSCEDHKPLYHSFAGNFKVVGVANIENFMRAIPVIYSKEYGWGGEVEIDNKNGYFKSACEGDGVFRISGALWNRADGKKLVIVSYYATDFNTHKGKRESYCIDGGNKFYCIFAQLLSPEEYSFLDHEIGFAAYIYNPKTKMLEGLTEPPFNGWEASKVGRFLRLPQKGKDIEVQEGLVLSDDDVDTYHTLKWNGMTFDYKE